MTFASLLLSAVTVFNASFEASGTKDVKIGRR